MTIVRLYIVTLITFLSSLISSATNASSQSMIELYSLSENISLKLTKHFTAKPRNIENIPHAPSVIHKGRSNLKSFRRDARVLLKSIPHRDQEAVVNALIQFRGSLKSTQQHLDFTRLLIFLKKEDRLNIFNLITEKIIANLDFKTHNFNHEGHWKLLRALGRIAQHERPFSCQYLLKELLSLDSFKNVENARESYILDHFLVPFSHVTEWTSDHSKILLVTISDAALSQEWSPLNISGLYGYMNTLISTTVIQEINQD